MSVQHGGDHYKKLAIQPAEYCHKNGIGFLAGSAIKYVTRYGCKNGAEDLKKAIHFLQMLLQMDYSISSSVSYTDGKAPENKQSNTN